MKSKISIEGKVVITLLDEKGRVKKKEESKNLVVTTGLYYCADRLLPSPTYNVMSHMAIGTGTNPPSSNDTTLQNEVARVGLSSTTRSNNSVIYTATFGPGVGIGAITEAGIFNAASGGTMLARTTFAVVNKGTNDTLQLEWWITITTP